MYSRGRADQPDRRAAAELELADAVDDVGAFRGVGYGRGGAVPSDGRGGIGAGEGRGVEARPAVDGVVAGAAGQRIVAAAAVDHVVAAVASDRVIAGTADHILDTDQRVGADVDALGKADSFRSE